MIPKAATFNEVTYPVQGMSCGSCIRHIRTALEGVAGVKTVEVNLGAAEVTVFYNPDNTDTASIAEAIRKSGYLPGVPREEQTT